VEEKEQIAQSFLNELVKWRNEIMHHIHQSQIQSLTKDN
jgi:hypothetical protein